MRQEGTEGKFGLASEKESFVGVMKLRPTHAKLAEKSSRDLCRTSR